MPTFAGFTLPDELRLIREQIRRFIREEIIPLEQRLDPDAPSLPEEDWERLASKTKAAGLWALAAPEEYGGGGLDTFGMCVLYEEMAQHRMGLYNIGCGVFGRYPPPAIWAGTKEQIKKYAEPTVREGWRTFFAITAHKMAIEHAKQRETFGQKLSQRQAVQWMLADAEVELRACRYLIWDGAWKADRGEDARVEASIAKLYSSEVLGRVVDAAVQIHGGYGVSKEFPLERWYREARVRRIGEGPSEVHRMVIARSLFR